MKRSCSLFIVITLLSASCIKEKEILKGDMIGFVTIRNQDTYLASDYSDVEVKLYEYDREEFLSSFITDSSGRYEFYNIPSGKYIISLHKENFLANPYPFSHLGGSPTIVNGITIYEIPHYEITIDSIRTIPDKGYILLDLKFDGLRPPFYKYDLIGYYSNSPDVSSKSYVGIATGYVGYKPNMVDLYSDGIIYSFHPDLPGTIYMRFYLLTQGQYYITPINPVALGKPSNVISLVWNQ